MSRLKVNSIRHTSATDDSIDLDSNGHVTIDGIQQPSGGSITNRNLVVNGSMNVAQRGYTPITNISGVPAYPEKYYIADRFYLSTNNSVGTYTLEVDSDTFNPGYYTDGLKDYLKVTVNTAGTLGHNDWFFLRHKIETADAQHLNYGSSRAKPLTLSFWVRSNVTGDASFNIRSYNQGGIARMFATSYNIPNTNWNRITINIPPQEDYVLSGNVGSYLELTWWLGSGTNYTSGSYAADWDQTYSNNRNVENMDLPAAANNYFQITGVQLEVGDGPPTPFEHRSYSEELRKCQRFYQVFSAGGSGYATAANQTNSAQVGVTFPVEMVDAPDLTIGTLSNSLNTSSVSGVNITKRGCLLEATSSNQTADRQCWYAESIIADAEFDTY